MLTGWLTNYDLFTKFKLMAFGCVKVNLMQLCTQKVRLCEKLQRLCSGLCIFCVMVTLRVFTFLINLFI